MFLVPTGFTPPPAEMLAKLSEFEALIKGGQPAIVYDRNQQPSGDPDAMPLFSVAACVAIPATDIGVHAWIGTEIGKLVPFYVAIGEIAVVYTKSACADTVLLANGQRYAMSGWPDSNGMSVVNMAEKAADEPLLPLLTQEFPDIGDDGKTVF